MSVGGSRCSDHLTELGGSAGWRVRLGGWVAGWPGGSLTDKPADRRSSRLEAQAKLDLHSLADARQTRPHDAQKGFDPLGVYSDTKLCNLLHMRSLAGALRGSQSSSSSGRDDDDSMEGEGGSTVTISAVRNTSGGSCC
eukprot:COSAG01_NODE_21918_length_879_cov_1.747436_1_plen_138_part_10